MSQIPSPTQDAIQTRLRAFLLSILPEGVEVVAAQDNRVPMPSGPDYITMNALLRERLSTNVTGFQDVPDAGTESHMQPTKVTTQLNVFGPNSSDNAQTITTLFQSEWGFAVFTAQDDTIAPLTATDPRQVPFVNGEQQYETRWVVDLALQVNATVTTPQDFADELEVTIIPIS